MWGKGDHLIRLLTTHSVWRQGIRGWEDFLHQKPVGGGVGRHQDLYSLPLGWASGQPLWDAGSPAALLADSAMEPSPGLFALAARVLRAPLCPSALAFLRRDLPGAVPLPSGLTVLSWTGFRVLGWGAKILKMMLPIIFENWRATRSFEYCRPFHPLWLARRFRRILRTKPGGLHWILWVLCQGLSAVILGPGTHWGGQCCLPGSGRQRTSSRKLRPLCPSAAALGQRLSRASGPQW